MHNLSLVLCYEEYLLVCVLSFQLSTLSCFSFGSRKRNVFRVWLLALVSHLEQQSVPQDYAHMYQKVFL